MSSFFSVNSYPFLSAEWQMAQTVLVDRKSTLFAF
jgi:hypothetical protein